MAVNNNSPIPREAIARAAGLDESEQFSIRVIDTKIYFKDKEVKIPYNVVSKSVKREILSTDLMEGMTIKAVTNKSRRQTLQNIEK